jgi:hypothetical protein
LLLSASLATIADVASLVLVSAMRVELVVAIEARPAEPTLRVSLEPALVDCSRVIITKLLMLLKIGRRKQLVLVRKDLLVPRAEITGRR